MKQYKKLSQKRQLTLHQTMTTRFGYGLFALSVVSFVMTILVPLGLILQSPHARVLNAVMIFLILAIGGFLPAIVGYFVGDKATKNRSKTLHHYNGVLLGILAYWLMVALVGVAYLAFSSIDGFSDQLLLLNVLPVVMALGIVAILAHRYTKKRQKATMSLLEYLPYQTLLFIGVLGGLVAPSFYMGFDAATYSFVIAQLVGISVIVAIAVLVVARNHTTFMACLTDALVAVSIAMITSWFVTSILSFIPVTIPALSWLAYGSAGLVFIVYLILMRTRR